MPTTHKKVIVRKLNRDSLSGYVASAFVTSGKLELLNPAGNVVLIDLADVKGVYFVRDFTESEDIVRKTFATRPRSEGLWVRLHFRDNDVLEGLMANDLLQASSEGFLVSPPDSRSNTQRIFVPRAAISELKVLGVIGSPTRPRSRPPADTSQREMFPEEHRV
ncbi:MAG: hypothetical protein ABSD20_04665 [Terriglobales bacterium]|jgi:hypothetical protein